MKAQVLHNIADIRYDGAAKPRLKKGWVLVKVMAAGVCGSDIPRIYKTGAHVHPLIPGHEFSGHVVEVYDDTASRWIGKRVGVFPLIPCGECECCQKKQYEMCSHYNYLGSRCDGGFAEYVAVPEWNLIELPDNVTYEQAAMMEPMAVAVHALRQFDISRNIITGDTYDASMAGKDIQDTKVCVIGLGTIGLLLTLFLKEMGIEHISVICNKEKQKANAMKLGISEEDICIVSGNNSSNDNMLSGMKDNVISDRKYDYIYECVGRNETIQTAIQLAAPAAHIVLVGNPYSDMTLDKDVYWNILRKQIKLSGTWNSSYYGNIEGGAGDNKEVCIDDWHYVLNRLAGERIHPEWFITHKYKLSELQKGMEIMRDKTEDYVKIMYVNNEQ